MDMSDSTMDTNNLVIAEVLERLKLMKEQGLVIGRVQSHLLIDAKKAASVGLVIDDLLTMRLNQAEAFGFMVVFDAVGNKEYLILKFQCMRLDPIDHVPLTNKEWPGVETLIAAFMEFPEADVTNAQKAMKMHREAIAALWEKHKNTPIDHENIVAQLRAAEGVKTTTLH